MSARIPTRIVSAATFNKGITAMLIPAHVAGDDAEGLTCLQLPNGAQVYVYVTEQGDGTQVLNLSVDLDAAAWLPKDLVSRSGDVHLDLSVNGVTR